MNEFDREFALTQAEQLYHIKILEEITTGNSGNGIFEAKSELCYYILRVCEYSQNKEIHIEFESRWTKYLADRMEGIVKPVRSENNNLYEVVKADRKSYILYLQEKAPGKMVDTDNPDEFNETLFFNLGALMGRMHKLSQSYKENVVRPELEWNGPNFWRRHVVILDEDVRKGEDQFIRKLESLPKGKDSYGIVHYDIHTENFLVDQSHITLIDFETCQFNWYAADVASALFFMVQNEAGPIKKLSEKERTDFAETYLITYLNGYLQTSSLSEYWINTIDLFLKYQMIDEYVCGQDYWPEHLSHQRQWYMNWYKDRIVNDLPYVHIDYNKVIRSVSHLLQ